MANQIRTKKIFLLLVISCVLITFILMYELNRGVHVVPTLESKGLGEFKRSLSPIEWKGKFYLLERHILISYINYI